MVARYRHTHWVASVFTLEGLKVFDINAMCAGGWIPFAKWNESLVPWLLRECVPKADGNWHITHSVEIAII